MASCRRKESPCQEGYRNQTRGTGTRTMPRQRGVHWTVWSVYISSYLYRDLLIDALYFRDPSDSHGISTMFLSLSLPRRPCILSSPCLPSFPSRVPVSLASRGYFDWGQTLGFHTIYNAALSNGIEYERGWNEHMLEKWRSSTMRERRTETPHTTVREIEEKDLKNRFHMYKPVCIYIIKASRIRSILIWKINRSYSMNNSFLPLPLEPTIVFCTIHGISLKNSYRADRGKKWPVVCLTVRIYRSRKVTEVHTEPRFRPKLNCSRL